MARTSRSVLLSAMKKSPNLIYSCFVLNIDYCRDDLPNASATYHIPVVICCKATFTYFGTCACIEMNGKGCSRGRLSKVSAERTLKLVLCSFSTMSHLHSSNIDSPSFHRHLQVVLISSLQCYSIDGVCSP